MPENFNYILKTEDKAIDSSQETEDVLKYSRIRIKRICKALCLSAAKYEPQKTVDSIKGYLSERPTRERILYSEISNFVYGLSSEEQGNFATNIEYLLTFSLDETNNIDNHHCKIIIKIYDHFQLAVRQKNLNEATKEHIQAQLADSLEKAKAQINETAKKAKDMEREYITILGIFSSVVLAFIGGLTFSTSVLQNIDTVSIYRLLFTVDILGIVLVNVIYLLCKFICKINDMDSKGIKLRYFNVAFIILGALIILAWLIDLPSLAKYISQWLPWIK